MEFTINLRISADETLTSLIKSLMGGNPGVDFAAKQMSKTIKEDKAKAVKEEEEDLVGAGAAPKISVEQLREAASSLMVKNKAALKDILAKYKAKNVAAMTEDQYADAYADMQKAMK